MTKKTCLTSKLVLFVGLIISLAALIFPPSSIKAQLTSCQGGSSTSSIRPSSNDLLTSSNDNSSGTFQLTGSSICGNRAAISLTSSYASLKSLYFDQQNRLDKKTITDSSEINPSIPLHYVAGDLTINQKIIVPANKSTVVFIDGNLNFSPAPAAPGLYNVIEDQNSSGIVFVVGGGINVHQDIRQINAFIITFGQFCSAYDFSANSCPGSVVVDNKLTLNGSVIALSSDTEKRPLFVRNLTDGNSTPAEEIVYQPKYLVILKGVFSRTRQTWSELTDYTSHVILPTAVPTIPPSDPTPPASPSSCDISNPILIGTCVLQISGSISI